LAVLLLVARRAFNDGGDWGRLKMLKSWRTTWLLAIAGLIFVLIVFLVLASSLSFQGCMEETKDYYASEGIPYFFLKGLENCVGSYIIAKHAVITALATAVIAAFTCMLWYANREQTKRHREVERAYIWGGGGLDKNNPNILVLTVNNYGKTPGLLTEFAVGFCHRTSIPATPTYSIQEQFHDWIPPIAEMIRQVRSVGLPPFPEPLIFGRFWFRDVWDVKHSIGFILVTTKDAGGQEGTTPIIPKEVMERVSPAYTAWN
jgi:hypothetical protein